MGLPMRAGPGPGALAGGRDVGIGPRNNKTTSRPLIRGARLAVESFTEGEKDHGADLAVERVMNSTRAE